MQIIKEIESQYLKESLPQFSVGDTVDVHVQIREGEKQRIQIFNGTVIRRKGSGVRETFTVRRIVQGEGVERIFPIHSPNVVDVEIKKRGRVRRAKLYYLRKRVGKGVRVREKLWIKDKSKKVEKPTEQTQHTPASTPEAAAQASKQKSEQARIGKKKSVADRAGKKKAKKEKRKQAKQKKKTTDTAPAEASGSE